MHPEAWEQVKAAFARLYDLAPDEARARLAADTALPPDVRAEVAALLVAHEESGQFLEAPGAIALAADAIPDPLIGASVGAYRIQREIARGGMGAVYEAVRADAEFEKRVALKVLQPGLATGAILERFRMERQILADLDHPNIARLLDAGTTSDGRPYFVMELVEGVAIDVYCRERALTLPDRVRLFMTVAGAVHHAHQHLVVHRDIKPGNVMVAADGTPKLLDFGIAKLVNAGGGRGAITTESFPMTPRYASPEQVRGEPVSTATDVYALGVLLYELLAGAPPYRLKTGQPAELSDAICHQDPALPSSAVVSTGSGASAAAALRGDLDTILLKALQKDPARRYASARELADDLGRHLQGQPVLARPDTLWYVARRFARRNRVPVAIAATALLLLVGAFAATIVQYRTAADQRGRAERRFNEVRELANSLIFDLHDRISQLPGSTPARERLVSNAVRYLDGLANETGADLALARELAGAYERLAAIQGGPSSANLGDRAGALASRQKTVSLRERVAAAAPDDAQARVDFAWSLIGLSGLQLATDTKEALRTAGRAEALVASVTPSALATSDNRSTLAAVYYGVASAHIEAGDFAAAASAFQRSAEIQEGRLRDDAADRDARRELTLTNKRLGAVLAMNNRVPEALERYRQALAADEAAVREQPLSVMARRDVSVTLSDIGWALRRSGDAQGALVEYRKALAIREALAEADPADADMASMLGSTLVRTGAVLGDLKSWDEADALTRRALAIYERLARQGAGKPGASQVLGSTHSALGSLAFAAGRYQAAAREYGKALDILRELAVRNPANRQSQVDRFAATSALGRSYQRMAGASSSQPDRCATLVRAERHLHEAVGGYKGLQAEGRLLAAEVSAVETVEQALVATRAELAGLKSTGGC